MKALTINQPWIHAILHQGKDIENRSWQRSYRGWLALHASAQPSQDVDFPVHIQVPALKSLDYSAICGVARVMDIVTMSSSKWFWHPEDGSINYGWVLENVMPLENPILCKGAPGLWDLSPKTLLEIKRQFPKLDFYE